MENSNNVKELQQKVQYYKRLIEDYEKTKQELNTLVTDRPKFTPPLQKQNPLDVSQKYQTFRTVNYPNFSKFKSNYVLNKTKGNFPVSNIPLQNKTKMQYKYDKTTLINKINSPKNDVRVQYKNTNTTLINKINTPKNDVRIQYKNTKTTLINKINAPKNAVFNIQSKKLSHESNLGLKMDILAPKYSTEPFPKKCHVAEISRTVCLVDTKVSPKALTLKAESVPKPSQNCNNAEKTSSIDTKVLSSCSSKPPNSYSQILNDIMSLTKELKQSAKDHGSTKSSFVTKAVAPMEKHPVADDRNGKVSARSSSKLKLVNKDTFCTLKNLGKSNSIDHFKLAKLNEIEHLQVKKIINKPDASSSTAVSLGSNLPTNPSTTLSRAKENLIQTTSNKKIFSSQYKVVNKSIGSHIKHSVLNLPKNKIVDGKSPCLLKIHQNKLHSPRVKNVLNTKYKIINKTIRNSTLNTPLQSVSCKKSRNVYKLVNNSPTIQSRSFKLETQTSKVKSIINTTPKLKACTATNVTPAFKLCKVKSKTDVYGSHHKNSIKRPRILNSKYKVINKSTTPKRNIFVNKSVFQFNSQKKLDRIQTSTVGKMSPIYQNSTPKPVLLRRLYKSKNKIINKNSTPVSQTAKMIKTKYVALYKQRSFPPSKQFISPRPKMFGYHLRPYYRKPRHIKHGHHASFYNPHSMRFLSVNQYSKINTRVKRTSLHKQRFISARFSYLNKFAPGYGKTSNKNSKFNSPVSQILASRVLHRSINQAVTKSTKKKLMKVNTYCMFYNRFGKCNKGIKCPFIHDPSKIAVCTRFLRGTCKGENCPFSHEVNPGKMALCTYFLLGSCKNDKCPYRHELLLPNSDLCKEFVQGYCSKGKKCDKAHILICPNYVKGSCDKGDKCLFPHPTQRAKKSTSQDVKEISHAKESEELLLENVNRYFQAFAEVSVPGSSSESPENCQVSVVVRRSRLLPEQPSFIPLSQSMEQLDGI